MIPNIIIGDSKIYEPRFTNGAGAIDISAYTVTFAMYASYDDETAIFEKTAALSDPTNGKCQVTITSAESAAMEFGRYWFKFKYESGTGTIKTFLSGQVSVVNPSGTHDVTVSVIDTTHLGIKVYEREITAVTVTDTALEINNLNEKTDPVDDDFLVLSDSEDSFLNKKVKISRVANGGTFN